MTRVTDLSSQAMSMALLRQTQARIETTAIQVSGGRVSETYSGISRSAARVVSLQADQARVQQYADSNAILGKRLDRMETNVASMLDLATNIRSQLMAAVNAGSIQTSGIAIAAGSALEAAAGLLNEKLDGKALFAGNATDRQAVDLSALPADGNFTQPAGAYYYKGDSSTAQAAIGDGQTLAYGLNADAGPFADLIQGLQIAKTTDPIAADAATRLQTALDLVTKALDTLPDLRSAVGTAQSTLDAATERHTTFVNYAKQAVGDVQNVDAADALTRLSSDQAVLQASYSVIGRLSSLSIIDYLK